jgi:hypothetical protein
VPVFGLFEAAPLPGARAIADVNEALEQVAVVVLALLH